MRSPASGGPPAWGRRAGKRSRQKGRGNISELGKRVNQWGLKQGLIANFVAVWAWHCASVHVTTVVNRVWNSSRRSADGLVGLAFLELRACVFRISELCFRIPEFGCWNSECWNSDVDITEFGLNCPKMKCSWNSRNWMP